MMPVKYTHLFFDLDNTLWDFDKNSFSAMHNTFLFFKLNDQCASFTFFFETYSRINTLLWDEYRKGKLVKKELVRQRFQLTFDELSITDTDPLEMNILYLKEMPYQKLLMPGTWELLEYLKYKGYLLHIITNGFREVQYKKLETTGLSKFFSKVFISEEVKATKPSREIFEYAVKSANARKRSCLMIGDDWAADIAGALEFGIDAVYINQSGKNERNEIVNKNSFLHQFSRLSDLNHFL